MVAFVALLVVSVVAVAGCGGGDTATAKKYMQEADQATEDMLEAADQLDKETQVIIGAAMTGDASAIDPAELSAVEENMSIVIDDIADVKSMYQNILGMEDVEDYKEYANAMDKFLDAQEAILEAGNELYGKMAPAINQLVETGDASGLQAALQEAGGELQVIEDLQDSADEAYKAAQKIKTDKGLE